MRRLLSGAVMAAVLLTGCSSNSSTPPAEPDPDGEAEIGISEPSLVQAKVGTPFDYQQTFSNTSDVVDWQVTVTKVECGLKVLKKAASNPDWLGDDDVPRFVDAKPADGQEFCRADATQKNVGKTPGTGAEDFGNLVTDQGEFQASSDDEEYASNLAEVEELPTSPFNPGSTAKVIAIWQVTAGAKPTAVLFPGTTVYSGPSHSIAVS
ncbi:hypothetical protein AB0F72_08955 [Actinoplanes sp. NPDC023936]|uniref:hypothetical protein n=1 Tax=Actinoplanes sp. NPDC023936 TaxID=3154910 RepID=UPI0033F39AD9